MCTAVRTYFDIQAVLDILNAKLEAEYRKKEKIVNKIEFLERERSKIWDEQTKIWGKVCTALHIS